MTSDSQQNCDAPFPKPPGASNSDVHHRPGGSRGVQPKQPQPLHFTVCLSLSDRSAVPCQPPLKEEKEERWRKGRGGRARREERRGLTRVPYRAFKAHSIQPPWSLSCLPLEASWTKHSPVHSLRALLL